MTGLNLLANLLSEHVIIVRQQLHQAELNGGLTLVAEKMDRLHSVAVRILVHTMNGCSQRCRRGIQCRPWGERGIMLAGGRDPRQVLRA
jgi:hypothetical protein